MPLCVHCGKELTCECKRPQPVGQTMIGCPLKKAAMWVQVLDTAGKSMKGVSVTKGSGAAIDTGDEGIVKFDPLDNGPYKPQVGPLKPPLADTHDLPEQPFKEVTLQNGLLAHVLFTLRQKAKLKVEVVAKDGKILKPAQITLDAGRVVATANKIADFGSVPSGEHKIKVVLHDDDARTYMTTLPDLEDELTFTIEPNQDKKVTVEVEPMYRKVRFAAFYLPTIPQPVWKGDNTLFNQFDDFRTRVVEVNGYVMPLDEKIETWETLQDPQNGLWKSKYIGKETDDDDINGRVGVLRAVLGQAANGISDIEGELKVFIAPECFFLGRYGALPVDKLDSLIGKLQELVKGAKWKHWVFCFGTVNSFYETEVDGVPEVFNVSPVIRGGWEGGDPTSYTRLIRKWEFSQEMPASGDIEHWPTEVRTPLSETTVSKGFGPTENETVVIEQVKEILDGVNPNLDVVRITGYNAIDRPRWEAMRTAANLDISQRGYTPLVRDLRANKTGGKQWMGDLRAAWLSYQNTNPKANLDPRKPVISGAALRKNLDHRDAMFSMKRTAGPWLDEIVTSQEQRILRKRLTFALEICADHLNGRLKASLPQVGAPVIDIQLVPSAGANITATSICVTNGGYVINCDGWNAPGYCGGPRARNASILEVGQAGLPWKSGCNPLYPHSELFKKGQAPPQITGPGNVSERAVTADVTDLFRHPGRLTIYKSQDLPAF